MEAQLQAEGRPFRRVLMPKLVKLAASAEESWDSRQPQGR